MAKAMKKAEMEAHKTEYYARMDAARIAESQGMYRAALNNAIVAWDYIDGMMQFERRYESRDFASIFAIDFVLKYAPLLLDLRSLEKLEQLLAERKRIERDTSADLSAELAESRRRVDENYRLWSYLEMNPETRQDELRQSLGGNQEYWRSVAEAWQKMGLLRRTSQGASYQLALTTRLGQIIPAKCPTCGEIAEAPKAMLLTATKCPACHMSVLFVFRAVSA